ncbi:MAG: cadherin-like beta sandwich domain-containing protein [Acutalibacteraceae bacterium]|nr:cadherin-like beta sandwich domain-containing protein [Acutalibacteraceae bacterium]
MKRFSKAISSVIAVIMALAVVCPSAFAREFAPVINTNNIGVNTQYKYEEVDPSWLRQLVIKEDMLSTNGLFKEEVLIPVCEYPYTTDAPNFKAHVEEYIELYTLDDDSQRAAYLYLLEQIGALSIIANPETSDKSKADWLREQGIIITEDDEKDNDKKLMISALYALMYNDFYYVIKGERLNIPKGTPLEDAVVMYLMALSGENSQLTDFVLKFFGKTSVGNLEDYIYYTSLMSLYTQGYVSPFEIPTISREEVYRRVAIMTIRTAGIAIDSETATTEEIRHKYLAAMMGTQYSVTIDPAALKKALDKKTAPYYILQRMAYEDAKVTISATKYSYEECFRLVLHKTNRFDLENEFFSDIFEYDIHLDNIRSNISVNPNPISKSDVSISINGVDVTGGSYAVVELAGKAKETITIVSRQGSGKNIKTSVYKVNVHQGVTAPSDSDLTGLIPTLGGLNNEEKPSGNSGSLQGPPLTNVLNNVGNAVAPLLNNVLILNEKGQLVDQYGNIVSDSTYETLPAGYDYVLNDDGIISIVPSNQKTTEPTTEENTDKLSETDGRKIIIIVSAVCIILLIIAIIVIAIISKKKSHMTEEEKMRARKGKEKHRKERKERRK